MGSRIRSSKFTIILTVLFAVTIIALAFYYLGQMRAMLLEDSKAAIIEITEQSASTVAQKMQRNTEILQGIAGAVSGLQILGFDTKNSGFEYTVKLVGEGRFQSTALLDSSGKPLFTPVLLPDSESDDAVLRCAKDAQPTVSDTYFDTTHNEDVLAFFAPVIYQNEVDMIVCGVAYASDMSKYFASSFYNNEGYSYIFDKDGNLLFGKENWKGHSDTRLSKMLFEGGNSSDTVTNIVYDFARGASGSEMITFNGNRRFISYVPIDKTNDMMYVSVVNENALQANANNILWVSSVLLLCIGIAILIILIVFFLEKRKYSKHIERLAYVDPLTELYNSNYLEANAGKYLSRSRNEKLAYATFDIHKFKIINDTYGFRYGNNIFKQVASVCRTMSDDDETVFKLSNDFFAMILKFDDFERLKIRIMSIFDKINSELTAEGLNKISLNFACGIDVLSPHEINATTIFDHADIARKEAKTFSDTRILSFEQTMLRKLQAEREIEDSQAQALSDGEFVVYLQPKVSLVDGKTFGAEALVRWSHPERGIISPINFIPLFERNGFVILLDYYVFECVCALKAAWHKQGNADIPISVNMSQVHLSQNGFVPTLRDIADKYDVERDTIEIEITESAFFGDTEHFVDVCKQLRKNGFRLSMDDFGSGFSSLNLLRKLPIDVLKIDKSFLDDAESERSVTVISSIIDMADKLSVDAICEGVETSSQVELLSKLGCKYAQGFFYSPPIPIAEFESRLKTVKA